jgi:tight junction protein 1
MPKQPILYGAQKPAEPKPMGDQNRESRYSDPSKVPFSERINMFKQQEVPKQDYKNYIKSVRDPVQPRLGPKPFRSRPDQSGHYDSGVENETKNNGFSNSMVGKEPSDDEDEDTEVVATARGTFDHSGGVLSSVETGVSIVIPRGAIPVGIQQEIYFKVCRELHDAVPPLDRERGERLLSPMVMCGPHGLRFTHPVELRLPHCASMTPDGWSFALKSSEAGHDANQWQNMQLGDQVGQNSVSVLIDHF